MHVRDESLFKCMGQLLLMAHRMLCTTFQCACQSRPKVIFFTPNITFISSLTRVWAHWNCWFLAILRI